MDKRGLRFPAAREPQDVRRPMTKLPVCRSQELYILARDPAPQAPVGAPREAVEPCQACFEPAIADHEEVVVLPFPPSAPWSPARSDEERVRRRLGRALRRG